jgi:hypothetical protein
MICTNFFFLYSNRDESEVQAVTLVIEVLEWNLARMLQLLLDLPLLLDQVLPLKDAFMLEKNQRNRLILNFKLNRHTDQAFEMIELLRPIWVTLRHV